MQTSEIVGRIVTCAETGKWFRIERDGCSFNAARDSKGGWICDAGVDARERRELLDRSKPFYCYLSSDMHRVTGWKDNTLGHVFNMRRVELARWSHDHGSHIWAVRVRDVHGGYWYGRGSGGMCITLRACKAPR